MSQTRYDTGDESLLAEYRDGSDDAFAQLFRKYGPRIFGYVLGIVGDADMADERASGRKSPGTRFIISTPCSTFSNRLLDIDYLQPGLQSMNLVPCHATTVVFEQRRIPTGGVAPSRNSTRLFHRRRALPAERGVTLGADICYVT